MDSQFEKTKYTFIATLSLYSIYFLGFRKKLIFSKIHLKNPNLIQNVSHKFLKYFFFPMLTFNINYAWIDYSMKTTFNQKIYESNLLHKYDLQYFFKTKDF